MNLQDARATESIFQYTVLVADADLPDVAPSAYTQSVS